MRIGKRNFLRLARLACFAVLLNALSPTVSHGLSLWRGGAGLIEVCTSFGIELIPASDETPQSAPGGAPKRGIAAGCGYCLAHAGSFALPIEVRQTGVASVQGIERPTLAPLGGARRLPWTAPQSRGPPHQV